ncbi:hypothetical protein PANO111632_20565 [Paracoccus nototheniae]|uniref:Uncharacterized protein n=1 Tax=Paracoccus nototheniae TaxID=2489002 RepID=A0ABW4DTP5_9RHOB|nr:hypothetical protein [Paracoccus nototheniae]
MTDTIPTIPDAPATHWQLTELIAQLKTFNNLLHELLQDRDQPAISDVIRDYLIAIQKIDESFAAVTQRLIAALGRQDTVDRSAQDQNLAERLDRLEAKIGLILGLLGHPMRGPSEA